jgi:hypothetical protein
MSPASRLFRLGQIDDGNLRDVDSGSATRGEYGLLLPEFHAV